MSPPTRRTAPAGGSSTQESSHQRDGAQDSASVGLRNGTDPRSEFMKAVWTSDLDSASRLVLAAIVAYMNPVAHMGSAALVKRTSLCKATVLDRLAKLVDAGWLVQVSRGGSERGGARVASAYRLPTVIPPDRSSPAPVDEIALTGQPHERDRSTTLTPVSKELREEVGLVGLLQHSNRGDDVVAELRGKLDQLRINLGSDVVDEAVERLLTGRHMYRWPSDALGPIEAEGRRILGERRSKVDACPACRNGWQVDDDGLEVYDSDGRLVPCGHMAVAS